jgi:hypothetical protein
VSKFCREVSGGPRSVLLILTDSYEEVAGGYAVRSPTLSSADAEAGDYKAAKVDGALAVAKTIDQPDGSVVVVVSAGVARSGRELLTRTLMHEAQHVHLHQNGDSADAIHRDSVFDRPGDLKWEFVWMAESVIDEFRCERSVYEGRLDKPRSSGMQDEFDGILVIARKIEEEYWKVGNLRSACIASMTALDRMAQFLAYKAAIGVTGGRSVTIPVSVPYVQELISIVSPLVSSREVIGSTALLASVLDVALFLRETYRDIGFDYYFMPDGSSYFQLLNPPV